MEFSNQYLTYQEYVSLGGSIEEMPFNILEFKVRKKIDDATFNRLVDLKEQIQEVKMCIYDLITELNKSEEQSNKSSESIDGYSVSYKTVDTTEQNKIYNKIIRDYLGESKLEDGTPYLYCGVEYDN